MPALNSLLRPHPVTVTIEYEGETVTIRYDRNKLTTRLLAEVQAAEQAEAIAAMYATVIDAWNITEEDGSPFPPTVENLARLPLDALRQLTVVMRDSPSSAEGKASAGLSSTPPGASTVPSPAPLNGPVTSSSPVFSESPSPS